jgi:hypothetical protein
MARGRRFSSLFHHEYLVMRKKTRVCEGARFFVVRADDCGKMLLKNCASLIVGVCAGTEMVLVSFLDRRTRFQTIDPPPANAV